VKFEQLKKMSDEKFRRITGVKRITFDKMVTVVQSVLDAKRKATKTLGGRPPKLSIENRILMTLEYLREYRTYVNIGISYGLSETRTFENIRSIENILIKSKEFSLPGKKVLLKSDVEYEMVLIDATESPIERPKKNNENFIQEKRKNIRSKHNL
jgi:Helix-turn-helix of DDE superfamily endonuclease